MGIFDQSRPRHAFRARRAAVAVLLGTVATCAGLAHAGEASAKTVDYIFVKVIGNDTNSKAHWVEAWNMCRSKNPDTRSVHYLFTAQVWNPGHPSINWWVQEWTCDDQP